MSSPRLAISTGLSILALALSTACSFDERGASFADAAANTPDAATGGDAAQGIDARPDARMVDARPPDAVPPDMPCPGDVLPFTPSNMTRCDVPDATSSVDLFGDVWDIDTDTGVIVDLNNDSIVLNPATAVISQTGGPDVRVIAVDAWNNDVPVWVSGSLPLVLVSYGDITVNNYMIAYAALDQPGPGGGISSLCTSGTGTTGVIQDAGDGDGTAGSGGGGGGYGDHGGGGARVNGASGGSVAAAGGGPEGNTSLVPLRGGCNGGDGGNTGGPGGGGGGAIQLVAAGTLTITGLGSVSARGGGGRAPLPFDAQPERKGGGGGGSGGAVLLEASTLTIALGGVVAAQGGAAGEGTRAGGDETNGAGDDGENGYSLSSGIAQGGADVNCSGGDGGDGATVNAAPQDGFEGASGGGIAAGGGGGGGSVGRIHFRAASQNIDGGAVISPAPL